MKQKPTKFDKHFGRFEKINPEYYKIALEYKPRLWKHITELSLNDRVYSDYIKITKSKDGICECVTCGGKTIRSNPMMNNWHFHYRKDYKYRFNDLNCYPQCRACNCANNWNYVNYTAFIANKLFSWNHQKAIDMFNDPEFVRISPTQQIDLVVEFRYPIIQERKKLLQ